MDKQVFAAIEIADHEIRLLVGEFFNTRFNVIKTERVPVQGLSTFEITDEEALVQAIQRAVENASKAIGVEIKRVLLAVPSNRMHRYPLKINVNVASMDKRVSADDIRRAVKRAMATRIDPELALIQAVCVKYTVNGISTRKIPLDEVCDGLTVDVDLLCAEKNMAYSLVQCVEHAGLECMGVSLDTFAIAKEAALFEQSVEHNIILLKVERLSTTLALISKGKLANVEILTHGVGAWGGKILDTYGLPAEMAMRLLKYTVQCDSQVHSEDKVYIWAQGQDTHTLSEKDLYETVRDDLNIWVDEIDTLCKPILEAGPCKVYITGEGGEMQGLNTLLKEKIGVDVTNYCPQTLGVRNCALTAPLGLIFAYQDDLPILGTVENSVDMVEYSKMVSVRNRENSDEDTLTSKLKGMLFEARK